MTTKEYWEQREKAHAAETKKSEDELAKRLRDRLDALQVEMDKQIHGFYSRYAKAEGITMAEAQQRVAEMDVKAFEAKAKKYVETRDFSDQANAELRLYNATMRINRLELLKAEMGLEMVDAYNDIQSMTGEGLTQRTLDEIARQAGILKSDPDNMLGQVDDIVNGALNNAKWSERIWMYQNQMKNVVSDMLTNGIIQGKNPRDLARELSRTFGSTKYDAERLMRTEMNRVQTEAQMESFKENGYDQYMFISTEDLHTCPICAEMNGKIFDVKDYAAGDNAPPMHPNCRCSTAAHMDMDAVYREVFGEKVEPEGHKESNNKEHINKTESKRINTKIASHKNEYREYVKSVKEKNASLSRRHKRLLERVPVPFDWIVMKASSLKLKDLAALTAATGDEYAIFKRGGKAILLRGKGGNWNIPNDLLDKLLDEEWVWEGHSHPVIGYPSSSSEDRETLRLFTWQKKSSIINLQGDVKEFTGSEQDWFNDVLGVDR